MISIETIRNGWVVTDAHGNKESHHSLQSLFESLLLSLDGKSQFFGGSMYGKVSLNFNEPTEREEKGK